MLPPPEPKVETWRARIRLLAEDVVVVRVLKTMAFLFKIWVLLAVCAPYTAKTWVLYPLLGMAIVDVVVVEMSLSTSAALLTAHLAIVWWLRRTGSLCSRPGFEEPLHWHE